jgi:hypothetical protein
MSLHPKDETTLARVVDTLRVAFGERLVAVALYGEAASRGYRPRRSPLDVAVVLDVLRASDLRTLRPYVGGWHRRRVSTPLLLDPAYLNGSRDAFPLEFVELRDHHRLLHGRADPFAGLTVHADHLRLELEEQAKGKLLHLREAYLGLGRSNRGLRQLLLETPPTFQVILRGLLTLRDAPRPDDPTGVLRAVEQRFGVSLPTLHRLERVRAGNDSLAGGELESVFERYLDEVGAIAQATDGL